MLGVRGGVCVVCVISNKNTWNPLQWQMHENQNSRIWSDIYGGKKNHEGPTWAKEKSKAKQALLRHPNIILCLRQKLSKTFSIFTPLRMCVCGTEEKIKNNSIRLPEPPMKMNRPNRNNSAAKSENHSGGERMRVREGNTSTTAKKMLVYFIPPRSFLEQYAAYSNLLFVQLVEYS